MAIITEPQSTYFDFDWSKIVDESLKREIEFTITKK